MNTTTATHINRSERNLGIDIGKTTLDVYLFELDIYAQFPNTPEGFKQLLRSFSRYKLTSRQL